jgi:hypothetical protein
MLRCVIARLAGSAVLFAPRVCNDNCERVPPLVRQKGVCGPGDQCEQVMIVMLPDEGWAAGAACGPRVGECWPGAAQQVQHGGGAGQSGALRPLQPLDSGRPSRPPPLRVFSYPLRQIRYPAVQGFLRALVGPVRTILPVQVKPNQALTSGGACEIGRWHRPCITPDRRMGVACWQPVAATQQAV